MKRWIAAGAIATVLVALGIGVWSGMIPRPAWLGAGRIGDAEVQAQAGGPHAGHGDMAPREPASEAATGDAAAGPAGAGEEGEEEEIPAEVSLSPEQQVLANIRTVKVQRKTLSEEIRAIGRVGFDERRLSHVTSRFEGRVDRMLVSAPGERVRRGQTVAMLYSPDLVAAQQELQVAREAADRLGKSAYPEAAQGAREMLEAARRKLRLWDLTGAQIAAMERARKPLDVVPVPATVAGTVVKRMAERGQYVRAGDALLDLADLATVWVEADVHEAALGRVRVGGAVRVTAVAFPGRTWTGRIAAILPALSAESRTGGIRVELANPGERLRPEMYVDAGIATAAETGLAVPASAVLDTGLRKVVWIKTDSETFQPRIVLLGNRIKDSYPVLDGLEQGEEIAVSGGFLLDASAQLQAQ